MNITSKELNAILGAIDFISTNADGAEDYSPFEEMNDHLRNVWKKGVKEHNRIYKNDVVKKAMKIIADKRTGSTRGRCKGFTT